MTPELKEIKRLYRHYMNGMVAQSMREKGMAYRVNFGLTMPLLRRIAADIPSRLDIAEELWQDKGVRESMLLAPLVCPAGEFGYADALRWASEIPTVEVADFCCKFLFAALPSARQLACEWVASDADMVAYTGYRLAYGLWDRVADDDFVCSIARRALLCEGAGRGVVSAMARQWLAEGMMRPESAGTIVSCIASCDGLDPERAEQIRALGGGLPDA